MRCIIYKVTYLPHLDTDYPKYYVGSKYNYQGEGSYYGSLTSSKIFEFTGGQPIGKWWKNIDHSFFHFEILEEFDSISTKDLIGHEVRWHNELDVLGNEYFNQSTAKPEFVSGRKSESTRCKMKTSLQQYYQTEEGIQKRKRISDRNSLIKSDQMKNKWQAPSEAMMNRDGRKKLELIHNDVRYDSWQDLYDHTGLTRYKYLKIYPHLKQTSPKFSAKRCDVCGKEDLPGVIARWHKNCKGIE